MAEIQQATNSADLTQRFIELVMMNAQQAALCLGQIAHPSTGKAEVNLPAAKMFIDHLEIIHEKTRGNLTKDEEKILTSVLSELQLAFVQVSNSAGGEAHVHDENCSHDKHHHAEEVAREAPSQTDAPKEETTTIEDSEGKKKFSKSYGA